MKPYVKIDVMNHTILIGIWHAYEFNQPKQWVHTCGPMRCIKGQPNTDKHITNIQDQAPCMHMIQQSKPTMHTCGP